MPDTVQNSNNFMIKIPKNPSSILGKNFYIMAWQHFCATILMALILRMHHQCCWAADQDVQDTIKMIDICQFIHDHLAQEAEHENLAVITCGKDVENARAQIYERGVGAGPSHEVTPWTSMKKSFLRMVNKQKFKRKQLEMYRKMLYSCVDGLVEKSEVHPNKLLIIQINGSDLNGFDNLLKNGRPFISRIVFQANFPIQEDFFIHLIETLLTPVTSANTIVQDIGIGTTTIGIWDRDILVETLNEKYFDEMTYNPGAMPHWEVRYKMDDKIRAKLHFCQWSEHLNIGQKFRLWHYEKEKDPLYIKKFMSLIQDEIKEICF